MTKPSTVSGCLRKYLVRVRVRLRVTLRLRLRLGLRLRVRLRLRLRLRVRLRLRLRVRLRLRLRVGSGVLEEALAREDRLEPIRPQDGLGREVAHLQHQRGAREAGP